MTAPDRLEPLIGTPLDRAVARWTIAEQKAVALIGAAVALDAAIAAVAIALREAREAERALDGALRRLVQPSDPRLTVTPMAVLQAVGGVLKDPPARPNVTGQVRAALADLHRRRDRQLAEIALDDAAMR